MPKKRNSRGEPLDETEQAMEAWSIAMGQMMKTGSQAVRSGGFLAQISDEDVQIAEAASEVVFEIDKVRLFHYHPVTELKPNIPPVVICYGLFGRQTMIDLQALVVDDQSTLI